MIVMGIRLAATPGLNNNVAVRQLLAHSDRATFRMMPVPSVVIAVIDVLLHYDIITIANANLRGNRSSASKYRPNGRR